MLKIIKHDKKSKRTGIRASYRVLSGNDGVNTMADKTVSLPELKDGMEYIAVPVLKDGMTRNVVTLNDGEVAVILSADTLEKAHKAFSMQTDYENESKFIRLSFMPEAVKNRLAYIANSAVQAWEREINKHLKKYPKMNREMAIAELCEARSYKEMMQRATAAEIVKEQL